MISIEEGKSSVKNIIYSKCKSIRYNKFKRKRNRK